MFSFILGIVVGAAGATYWRSDLRRLAEQHLPTLRGRAADGLQTIEQSLASTLERTSTGVRATLRAAEGRLRGSQARTSPAALHEPHVVVTPEGDRAERHGQSGPPPAAAAM